MRSERALLIALAEMYVQGVSTRKGDRGHEGGTKYVLFPHVSHATHTVSGVRLELINNKRSRRDSNVQPTDIVPFCTLVGVLSEGLEFKNFVPAFERKIKKVAPPA